MQLSTQERLIALLDDIYVANGIELDTSAYAAELLALMRIPPSQPASGPPQSIWSESDVVLITYADSIRRPAKQREAPLKTLHDFIERYLSTSINTVHVLPFFPHSSDSGFSVIDFDVVDPELGDWDDVEALSAHYRVMADLVINHGSAQSQWFSNYLEGRTPGAGYYLEADPALDYQAVVRPRTSPLLREVETSNGVRHVWCTFSHDQVDFNFRNPALLGEFVRIIRKYLDNGVRIFRLDAVAFIWKELGTRCINLHETHALVRLLRLLLESAEPDSVVVTETNIPNQENLSYFGNANEAHWIYNFSLPPLLLYTLMAGDCTYLKRWMMSMPPAQVGTAYFNFLASHDGIGLRPTEGLLTEREIDSLVAMMENFGGRVSYRSLPGGASRPYEINISLIDAMRGTFEGVDDYAEDRFLCAHALMFALEGVPGVYVHSFLATGNDYEGVERFGENRAINRHKWDHDSLVAELAADSQHARILSRLSRLLQIRREQPAFHPNATQFTLHLGDQLFGFWRQSMQRDQSIFAIANISSQPQQLDLSQINLIAAENWFDLISGDAFPDHLQSLLLHPYQTLWISNSR